MDSSDKKVVRFRRILCILSFMFLGAGIILTIIDYKNTVGQVQKMKKYKIVQAQSLEAYRDKEEENYLVVKNIHIVGNLVQDPMGVLDGEYYYINAKAQTCVNSKNHSGTADDMEWEEDKEQNLYTVGKLYTEISDAIPVDTVSLYGIPKIDLECHANELEEGAVKGYYYYPEGTAKGKPGNVRYSFYSIPKDAVLSAVVVAGNGRIKVQKLIPQEQCYYVYGDESSLYDYMEEMFVGDNLIFLLIGVGISILFLFIAYLLTDQRSRKN